MPATTLLDIPPAEQAQMRTIRRRMRLPNAAWPSLGVPEQDVKRRRAALTSISG